MNINIFLISVHFGMKRQNSFDVKQIRPNWNYCRIAIPTHE
ncbi:unnamed protein product, partial [Larinioides sclopetarius]